MTKDLEMEGTWSFTTKEAGWAMVFKSDGTFSHGSSDRAWRGKWEKDGYQVKLIYEYGDDYAINGNVNCRNTSFNGYIVHDNSPRPDYTICTANKLRDDSSESSDSSAIECVEKLDFNQECLVNEVKFLKTNFDKWGEQAVNRIKEIYEKNPELTKSPLYNSFGLTHFFNFFSLDELNQFIYKNLSWVSENMDKIKDQDMRCKLVDKLLDTIMISEGFKITKEDLKDVEWELYKLNKLVKWDAMPEDFDVEFDEDLVKDIMVTSPTKTALWYLNQLEYLETDKVIQYAYVCGKKEIIQKLMELNKIYVLMENLKPHGVSVKLLTEHVEKEGRVY